MKQNKTEEHIHHHWNIDELLKFLIVLVIVLTILGWVGSTIREPSVVYGKCVSSCSKGVSTNSFIDQIRGYPPISNDYGFNRNLCIRSCNKMYIELKSSSQ